ncbi:IgE-binding protein [Metarhizium rileyi]|uniref:IgE-binding protein n=1 Tax=Metarhizium rileyi (strain RCEF 4871) TaxID=1649241 RepID=A0A166RZ02_METRR|nr:IgE-binding protein [Metarhizium rileyi RCEF 4871]
MKPSAPAAVVFAVGIVFGQIDVLTETLSRISDGVKSLDNAVTNFDIDAIKSEADALISTITSGHAAVNTSKSIMYLDSLALGDPVQRLNKESETLAANLKAKRPNVEKANSCTGVRSRIAIINTDSLGLIEAVVAKFPQAAQGIAKQIAAGTSRAMEEAQDEFSKANCKDTTPTSSTSATGTVSSSSSPTTMESLSTDSKQTRTGAIIGGVLGGVGAIGLMGLFIFIFLRLRKQRIRHERANAVELDGNEDSTTPQEKHFQESSAEMTGRNDLGAQDTERHEMCGESTAIDEAPGNERYELE